MSLAAVAITGVGAVSSLGRGVDALCDGIFAGRDGIRALARFDPKPFGRRAFGAVVPDAKEGERAAAWAAAAAREAVAGIDLGAYDPRRVAVVMGTSLGRAEALTEIARAVADAVGAQGPRITVSTACTSSANALGHARDLLRRGDADLVLAGGADELTLALFAGFHALGVLAEGPCGPFGPILGTTLGEGAAVLALTRGDDHSAPARAYLAGYGLSSDAFHETSPDPRGSGVARAIRSALTDAGWSPDDIAYVNAHATGTAANDEAEWLGIEGALGETASRIPISGSKATLGHAQGAASALELLATLVCVERGCVPPSLRAEGGRKRCPPDVVAGPLPRPLAVTRFLAASSAFGGANAVLAVSIDNSVREVSPRPVSVLGFGRADASIRGDAVLRERVPSADPRVLDPLGRFTVAACAAALDDAGLRVTAALRDRAGIVFAAPTISPESGRAWRSSLESRGVLRPSVGAFARLVLHAAAGSAAKALSLRGPASTLAGAVGAGLAAVITAVDLASRDDVDAMVAVAADECPEARPEREGAAAVVLGRGPGVARVSARWMGGRDATFDAPVDAWITPDGTRTADAVAAVGRAVEALRNGATRIGVRAGDDDLACALVLERGDHGP